MVLKRVWSRIAWLAPTVVVGTSAAAAGWFLSDEKRRKQLKGCLLRKLEASAVSCVLPKMRHRLDYHSLFVVLIYVVFLCFFARKNLWSPSTSFSGRFTSFAAQQASYRTGDQFAHSFPITNKWDENWDRFVVLLILKFCASFGVFLLNRSSVYWHLKCGIGTLLHPATMNMGWFGSEVSQGHARMCRRKWFSVGGEEIKNHKSNFKKLGGRERIQRGFVTNLQAVYLCKSFDFAVETRCVCWTWRSTRKRTEIRGRRCWRKWRPPPTGTSFSFATASTISTATSASLSWVSHRNPIHFFTVLIFFLENHFTDQVPYLFRTGTEQRLLMVKMQSKECLGREQAELLGKRLGASGIGWSRLVMSTMVRATETANIAAEALAEQLKISSDSMLEEGAPYPPEPPITHWRPQHKVSRLFRFVHFTWRHTWARGVPNQPATTPPPGICKFLDNPHPDFGVGRFLAFIGVILAYLVPETPPPAANFSAAHVCIG